MAVWMDCVDDRQPVPTWKSTIVAKVTRLAVEDEEEDDDEDFHRPVPTPPVAPAPVPQPAVDLFGGGPAGGNLLDGHHHHHHQAPPQPPQPQADLLGGMHAAPPAHNDLLGFGAPAPAAPSSGNSNGGYPQSGPFF